jgi:hypothetical protein
MSASSFDFSDEILKSLLKLVLDETKDALPKTLDKLLHGKSFSDIIKTFQSDYFYQEELVKTFLFSQDWSILGKTDLIDYDAWQYYYPKDKKTTILRLGSIEKQKVFPFKEEINFILHPDAKIAVSKIGDYILPEHLERMTESNLQAFRSIKPQTFDGQNLRLASLKKISVNEYECVLERASYFPQARTNLSVDFRLNGQISGQRSSLRLMDMGPHNELKSLRESCLVNTIGTSAVVYYHKHGKLYFFMKLRKQLGVYENMFGTTSGEVENPSSSIPAELVSYVEREMLREFSYETGLNQTKFLQRIHPLAFTRDLIRGGKPQFFFLIEISEVSEQDFSKDFKKSIEGMDEFQNDLASKFRFQNVFSPEFALNLVYAFQLLLAEKRRDIEPLVLD